MQLVATVLNSVARERSVWHEYVGGMRRRNRTLAVQLVASSGSPCVGWGWGDRESGKGKKGVGEKGVS